MDLGQMLQSAGKGIYNAGAQATGAVVGRGLNITDQILRNMQQSFAPPQTKQLPQNIQSPVSQNQIVQHPEGDSWLGIGFNNLMSHFQQNPAQGQPTPTPTMQPTGTPNSTAGMPTPMPGQSAWQQANRQYLGNFSPQQQTQMYHDAVTTPGGHYYETAPTQTQSQPTQSSFPDFTITPVPEHLAPLIHSAAQQANVDPNVFASLLFTEHGFQTTPGYNYNTDGSYDRGIAQINNRAHPEVSDQQALDPNFAVPYAANLLSHYIQASGGDINHGIAAYNVGVGGAQNSQVYNTKGQRYLDAVARGLSPQLIKKLGIKPSFTQGR